MSPNQLKQWKTYCNRGAGKTRRTVVLITSFDDDQGFPYIGCKPHVGKKKVYFRQYGLGGRESTGFLLLEAFATWAGREVVDEKELP
jgi:hypothetical protein